MSTIYCACEEPVIDLDHDAGCRRCGLPVNFGPNVDECSECGHLHWDATNGVYVACPIEGCTCRPE